MMLRNEQGHSDAESRLTVLVVEDEPSVRAMMRLIIERAGYALLCAGNGADAIEITAQAHPDLILLDLYMPGMDGIETLRRIRRFDTDVPVVILTGYPCPETIRDAVGLGVTEYLSKPFENRELVAIIHASVNAARRGRGEPGQGPVESGRGQPTAGAAAPADDAPRHRVPR